MSTTLPNSGSISVPFVNHLNEEYLVAQAKLGSEQAFTELWSRHGKRARNVVLQIMRNQEDAEDALQETYLKSFLHLVAFNGKSQFSTWLYRIAINEALMLLRKRRNRREAFFESTETDPSVPVIDIPDRMENIEARYVHSELIQQLRMAIGQLPYSQRYLIELQNRDELPLVEIAHLTGLSLPAVKSRLVRARAALRELTSRGRIRQASQRRGRRPKELNFPAPSVC
jgi:RNA polymerase sigma-70 factor, ECF subfamily